jgi:hypothetical protein
MLGTALYIPVQRNDDFISLGSYPKEMPIGELGTKAFSLYIRNPDVFTFPSHL